MLPILDSPWSEHHSVEILTWPDLDLAALVVSPPDRDAFTRALRPVRIPDEINPGVPPYPAELELRARAGVNVCPSIPASRRSMITVEQLWESMDETDRYAVLGSLGDDTLLLSYASSAQRGTSGGPLIWRHAQFQGAVAVHLGGKEGVLQWGVLLGAASLRERLASNRNKRLWLDSEHPRVVTPGFRQPALLESNLEDLAEIDVALDRNSLSLMTEVGTPIDPFGAVSIFPSLGWSHLWFSPSFAPLDTAFGSRIVAGPIMGLYRSPVTAQHLGREEKPREGSANLPFHGGAIEADAELHLARLAPVRYVVSAGFRLGWSRQRHVEPAQDTFVFGPVLSGRARWQWTGALSGLLQLNISLQQIPVAATPSDCVGPSVPRPSVWDLWGSVAIGVETPP
ncbi:MAG TPA: hypothetical protein VK524_00855 [Polyangiaceae bacterium]|nr:hypothetical protein [Polyangiaceae bacterium]